MNTIFTEENINAAIELLMKKRNSCGNDGVMLYDLKEYLQSHKNILLELKNGVYIPGVAIKREINTNSSKTRTIYIMNSVDRLITKVISDFIYPEIDILLNNQCLAYRKNRNTSDCAEIVKEALNNNRIYVVKIDIKDFFENVKHDALIKKLTPLFDINTLNIITKYLKQTIVNNYNIYQNERGLIQGNSMSPILSNLYLNEFDSYINNNITDSFYRYGDDIAMFFNTEKEAESAFKICSNYLKKKLNLQVNEMKSGIFPTDSQKYLGYIPVRVNGTNMYEVIKQNKSQKVNYNWEKTGLRVKETTVEIIENGILTVKDMNVLFNGDNTKLFLPINSIKNINIYSNVMINPNLLSLLNKYGISLTVFDKFGRNIGKFTPEFYNHNSNIFLKQCELYNNENKRLKTAIKFVYAEIYNMRSVIKYYKKKYNNQDLILKINELSNILKEITTSVTINELMLKEARAKEIYYSVFDTFIHTDQFYFSKRTKRPPKNAVNSMISFGNCVLYNHISNEINKSSLNVKVGCLHSTNNRNESLNLDIAEIYKPIIIDRLIFTLINKHMINKNIHFEVHENGGIYLTAEGKKIFLKQYYKKMNSKITVNGVTVSYKTLIWNEIIMFQNYINNKSEFKPYHYAA